MSLKRQKIRKYIKNANNARVEPILNETDKNTIDKSQTTAE